MTPEEKAKELFNKFIPHSRDNSGFGYNREMEEKNAKSCVIICVDEIIQELEPDDLFKNYNERVTYWRDVKEEISKL